MHAPLMDDHDWDLFAVVRAASSFAISDSLSNSKEEDMRVPKDDCLSNFCELQDLCKPTELKQQQVPLLSLAAPLLSNRQWSRRGQRLTPPNSPFQTKEESAAEGVLPSAGRWRPAGPVGMAEVRAEAHQRLPYPRGYYRCSSSKACEAKKQVERSRADPEMLLVTYTAEHNHPAPAHRNSLAGTARQKQIFPSTIPPGQEPASSDMHFLDEFHFYHSTALTCFDAPAPADGHSSSSIT